MVTVRFVPRESHKNMYTQAEISISFGPPKTKKRCKVAKEAANWNRASFFMASTVGRKSQISG